MGIGSNPLVAKVFEYRRDCGWDDNTVRIALQFSHGQSSAQIDEIMVEANAPKTETPLNGHSTQQEIMTAATIEQTEEKQPPAAIAAPPAPVDYYAEVLGRLREDTSERSVRKTLIWLQVRNVTQEEAKALVAKALAELPAMPVPSVEPVAPVGVVSAPAEQTQLKASALAAVNLDLFVFALGEGVKEPDSEESPNGFRSSTNDREKVSGIWTRKPKANIGIDCGSSDLCVFDFDRKESIPAWVDNFKTLKIQTAKGIHVYTRGARSSKRMYDETGKHIGEIKSIGGYVIWDKSVHPSGAVYQIIDNSPIAPVPDDHYDELIKSASTEQKSSPSLEGEKIPYGQHDNELTRIAGKLRGAGMEEESIYTAIVEVCEKRCEGYGHDYKDMCRKIAHSVCRYPVVNTDLVLTQQTATQASNPSTEAEADQYAMTPEEIDAEMEKEFPVIPLVTPGGPTWDDDIMYGVLGDIVRKACASSEAHPAGVYLDFIVSLGNIFGRSAYFTVDSKKHFTNEFMVRVGATSKSRKGTGRDIVNHILSQAAADWYTNRLFSGLSSAEAIVNEVRDSRQESIQQRKKGEISFQTILVPGVHDKRLYVREDEIANVFWLIAKKESRADSILRDAWDGVPLGNIVKGKSQNGISNSAKCAEPHISISGDTTRHELLRRMPDGSAENGFGNRFIWCYVQRLKKCPMSSPPLDWMPEVIKLHQAIEFAKQQRYVPLSNTAAKMFKNYYMDSSLELTGLAGKMTDRAMPHIRRIAMILALLDLSAVVESRHMKAARQLWDYCQESAEYIFSGTTKDQNRIVEWVRNQTLLGSVTVAQVRENLFKRNRKADWVRAQVTELIHMGKLFETNGNLKVV